MNLNIIIFFHNNSIVNGKFNIKKLDLLEMTDLMAEAVSDIYPSLGNAVKEDKFMQD